MKSDNVKKILIALCFSAVIAAAVAAWSAGDFGIGWWGAFVLSLPFSVLGIYAWCWGGKGKLLAAMMLVAFALRLGGGLAVQNLLPIYGHPDEQRELSGFLFDDAYRRDGESWAAAKKENLSFFDVFTRKHHNDQYGAMVSMGILIYQYLSPDAHRFSYLFLLGAFFTALGLPFLWRGINGRWGHRIALITCWIYVLYPDAIFYSSASMREPFLIGLTAVAFWALSTMRDHRKTSVVVLVSSIIAMLPFSHLIAEVSLAAAVLWIWAEILIPIDKRWLTVGVVLMIVGVLGAFLLAMPAFEEWIHYDIHTTENGSGWVEKVVGEIGGQFRSIFVAIYGLTQPVLPAILVYPVPPACVIGVDKCTTIFWKVTGIYRAVGWYVLVPFLFYAIFSTLRKKRNQERTLLIVNALFVLGWIFLASLRAGGDQWDNPRYRVIFLPWLAFLCAWGIDRAIELKDWWLVRWIAIELIFLAFFTQWYASRYSGNAIHRYPFWKTVTYIILCSALVFATGLIAPIRARLHKKS